MPTARWSIGWFCRLCTRVSFHLAADLGRMFLGWAPPASAIEEWVLGLGRPAYVYLSDGPLPEDDGEVLVIEIDGKAVPTATEQEMNKRRRPRGRGTSAAASVSGIGAGLPQSQGRKKRRKKGDKSKNGRSATLVVMYTLRRGEDGRLHGPINKKVFGTFGSRKSALQWAREQATRRGFPPGDRPRRCRSSSTARLCLEQQTAAAVPRGDPDAGHPPRAGEALGGGPVVPSRRQRRSWRAGSRRLEELLYKGQVRALLRRLEQELGRQFTRPRDEGRSGRS